LSGSTAASPVTREDGWTKGVLSHHSGAVDELLVRSSYDFVLWAAPKVAA
jgi:hypothetical protein